MRAHEIAVARLTEFGPYASADRGAEGLKKVPVLIEKSSSTGWRGNWHWIGDVGQATGDQGFGTQGCENNQM